MTKRRLIILPLLIAMMAIAIACSPTATEPEPVVIETAVPAEPTAIPEPTAVPTLPPPVISGGEESNSLDSADTQSQVVAAVEVEEAVAAPQAGCAQPWSADAFGYGVQSHAIVGDPAFTMDSVKNGLGMQWVKVQLEWWLVQPSDVDRQWFFYDGVVDEANKAGLCLMFSIVGSPDYLRSDGQHNGPPDDYERFGVFLGELLDRYPNQIHAIEVWNEMNLDREWKTDNGVNAADYVRFLQISNDAIKAKDCLLYTSPSPRDS